MLNERNKNIHLAEEMAGWIFLFIKTLQKGCIHRKPAIIKDEWVIDYIDKYAKGI
ncbi:MAG: hypothetical protein N2645_09195 [Clostridia bacterium]|nr:hypothetical protein [Clostridia bacterium]